MLGLCNKLYCEFCQFFFIFLSFRRLFLFSFILLHASNKVYLEIIVEFYFLLSHTKSAKHTKNAVENIFAIGNKKRIQDHGETVLLSGEAEMKMKKNEKTLHKNP